MPVAKARIRRLTDEKGKDKPGTPLEVDFNPASLGLVIRNQMEAGKQTRGKKGRPPQQVISASEVTLTVELLFDDTLTGKDVRKKTAAVAEMMRPGTAAPKAGGKQRPSMVRFEWASFALDGIITDYNETIDYFSEEGVPLRASLNLSITKHEAAFPPAGTASADVGKGAIPPTVPLGGGKSVSDAASETGNPGADSLIGASNGLEDIRGVSPDTDELAEPLAAADAAAASGALGSPLRFFPGADPFRPAPPPAGRIAARDLGPGGAAGPDLRGVSGLGVAAFDGLNAPRPLHAPSSDGVSFPLATRGPEEGGPAAGPVALGGAAQRLGGLLDSGVPGGGETVNVGAATRLADIVFHKRGGA